MNDTDERPCAARGSLLLTLILLVAGCKDTDRKAGEIDFHYKVVRIEGREWIAYRSAHGIWEIAGPIDCPSNHDAVPAAKAASSDRGTRREELGTGNTPE